MISHLLNIVYGIVFGVANIIPGVSGGTMMVVFGVYDKVVDVLTLKLSAIKKNIRFIVFFGIGAVIGILGFSFVITWLFDKFPLGEKKIFFFYGTYHRQYSAYLQEYDRRRQKNHAEMPFCIYPGTCAGGRNDLYK